MARTVLMVFVLLEALCSTAIGQSDLASRINAIVGRPEFKHALFGIEVYSLKQKKVLYGLNENKLFVPGSVTKVVTEGTVLQLLGADYRFHTCIYRTGPITDGVLHGDLVLVASGDPNLSNRVGTTSSFSRTKITLTARQSKQSLCPAILSRWFATWQVRSPPTV